MNNRTIIIGGNHVNTLGLIRGLGVNGVHPYLVLVAQEGGNNYCAKSKFVSGVSYVKNNEEALEVLRDEFTDETTPPILMPSSDGAIFMIDTHHEELKRKYLIPHINNKQGEIARLMNKMNQSEWAHSIGIKTARTYLIDLQKLDRGHISTLPSICVIKPVLSHEGRKIDICKCKTHLETENYLEKLKTKGYKQCLVQEFINYDCQYVIHGCILQSSKDIPHILLQNLREWPATGGTGCYRAFVEDEQTKNIAQDIVARIRDYGYRGLFDIEFFKRDNEFLLNEVNFRSSGVGYSMFHNRVYYPYYYYQDRSCGESIEVNTMIHSHHTIMSVKKDINHVRYGSLTFRHWIKDFFKTRDFATFMWGDLRPMFAYYWPVVRNRFRVNRLFNL